MTLDVIPAKAGISGETGAALLAGTSAWAPVEVSLRWAPFAGVMP